MEESSDAAQTEDAGAKTCHAHSGEHPPKVNKLTEVADALEQWDRLRDDYVEIGGHDVPEDEKITIALKVLPRATPSSMLLALRKEKTYEDFKAALAEEIQFLDDHGGLASGNAHAVMPEHEEQRFVQGEDYDDGDEDGDGLSVLTAEQLAQVPELPSEQQASVLAMMRQNFRPRAKAKAKAKARGGRVATPPRTGATARPVKCANCNREGHTAKECRQPRVADELRFCFNCLKPGHRASDYPEAQKKGNGKAKLVEAPANGVAAGPRLLMIGIDEEGFETVTRRRSERVPGKFTLADMLIMPGRTTQRVSKALMSTDLRRQRDYNRYAGLGDDEADEPKFRLLQRNGNIGDPRSAICVRVCYRG